MIRCPLQPGLKLLMGFGLLHDLLPLPRLRRAYPTGHFFGFRLFLGYFGTNSS